MEKHPKKAQTGMSYPVDLSNSSPLRQHEDVEVILFLFLF